MTQNNDTKAVSANQPKKSHRKTMKVGGVLAAIGAIGSAIVGMLMPTGIYMIFGALMTAIIGLFSALGAGSFGSGVESLFSDIISQPIIVIFGILSHIVLLVVMIAACIFVILMLIKRNENNKKSVILGLISTIIILLAPYIATGIMSIFTFILDTQGLTGRVNIIEFVFAMEMGAFSIYWVFGGILWLGFLIAGFIIRFLWVGKWSKEEN